MFLSLKLSYEILFCKSNIQVSLYREGGAKSANEVQELKKRKRVKSISGNEEKTVLKKSSRYFQNLVNVFYVKM